jgi:hypothetical protein
LARVDPGVFASHVSSHARCSARQEPSMPLTLIREFLRLEAAGRIVPARDKA